MVCGIAIMMAAPAPAIADGAKCNRWTRSCKITSQADRTDGGTRADRNRSAPEPDPSDASNRRLRESRKKFSAALAAYDRRLATYTRCVQTFDPSLNNSGCGNPPTPPTPPELGSDTFSGRGNQPAINAGQAAQLLSPALSCRLSRRASAPRPTSTRGTWLRLGIPCGSGPTALPTSVRYPTPLLAYRCRWKRR
jgi:hypothetical protein